MKKAKFKIGDIVTHESTHFGDVIGEITGIEKLYASDSGVKVIESDIDPAPDYFPFNIDKSVKKDSPDKLKLKMSDGTETLFNHIGWVYKIVGVYSSYYMNETALTKDREQKLRKKKLKDNTGKCAPEEVIEGCMAEKCRYKM